jgi:endonuclease/exonuclease/phosphatase (EEP) superfamily protein YafD
MPSLLKDHAVFRAFARLTAGLLWLGVWWLLVASLLPWLAGLLPWPPATRAWITVLENLRLHIATLAALTALASLLLWRGRLVVAACLVVALSGAPIVASIQAPPSVAAETPKMKVLAFNIWTRNHDLDRIMAYLRAEQPDIVFLEEVKEEHKQVFAALKDLYPTQVTCHESTTACETMLLSRYPARSTRAGPIDGALPSAAIAELEIDGRVLTAVATHVVWPFPFAGQDAQREQLLHLAQSLQDFDEPLLLGGDFNGGAWVRNQRDFKERTGLIGEPGYHPTWPALPIYGQAVPEGLRIPIDHVFARGGLVVLSAEAGPKLGSDHLPLMTTVAWPHASTASAP